MEPPVDNEAIESFHRSIKRERINSNKNKTKPEMKVIIHDDLINHYVNHRIHTKVLETLKQHEEEIRESLNFV